MTNKEKDDFILRLLTNKAGLLQYIAEVMFTADRDTNGLLGMKERGFSTEGMLENVLKVAVEAPRADCVHGRSVEQLRRASGTTDEQDGPRQGCFASYDGFQT